MHGLTFHRPPSPLARFVPDGARVGLYYASGSEAPARAYAQWYYENGCKIALPWFAARGEPMHFREWNDPWEDEGIETGPYGIAQPAAIAAAWNPDVVFVPLLAFTAEGDRLGQGSGCYDRWLAQNPAVPAIGLAWDCQLVESLPLEPHDRRLDAVVTPTRFYEGHPR